MPDRNKEESFVNSFIVKSRRERLLYELSTPKKRYDGISRFCHQAGDFIDSAAVLMSGDDIDRRAEFRTFVKEHDNLCSVLSPLFDEDLILSLKDAVDLAVMGTDAYVIIGDGFAVVFGEAMKDGRDKYLLAKKLRAPDQR